MKKIIYLLVFVLSAYFVKAQNFEFGIAAGVATYNGDLSPIEVADYFETFKPSFGGFVRYNANDYFSFRLGLQYSTIEGDDVYKAPERGLNFKSDIFEVHLLAEFYPFVIGNPDRFMVLPYAFAGVGGFHFNPLGRLDNNWEELQPFGTEGQGLDGYDAPYDLTQVAIPLGGGIRFVFDDSWSLGIELGGRKTFTDYLDDISAKEVNYLDILEGNGSISAQLSNPTFKEGDAVVYSRGGEYTDWYFTGTITLSVNISNGFSLGGGGRGMGCPNNF